MSCRVQAGDSITITMTLLECPSTDPLNISTASTKTIVLKGTQSRFEKTADFVTDGSDGQLTAVLTADQLAPAGEWQIQAVVIFPGGIKYHSEVKRFVVSPNI